VSVVQRAHGRHEAQALAALAHRGAPVFGEGRLGHAFDHGPQSMPAWRSGDQRARRAHAGNLRARANGPSTRDMIRPRESPAAPGPGGVPVMVRNVWSWPRFRFDRTSLARIGASALACSALSLASYAGGVRVLERPQLGTFATLQQAIDAALDGETLIVGGGVYGSFTVDGKTLAIVAMANQSVEVHGTITISNLTAQRWVTLVDIDAIGAQAPSQSTPPPSDPALRLTNDAGDVHIQRCSFTGGEGRLSSSSSSPHHGAGGPAVVVSLSSRVSFAECLLVGGEGGATYYPGDYETQGGDGGHGLSESGSTVVLYDCTLQGGEGGTAGCQGGGGGDGCHVVGATMIASNTAFAGDDGGDAWDFLCYEGGNGGDGIELNAFSQAHLLACTFAVGAGGWSGTTGEYSPSGVPIAGPGTAVQHPGTARQLSATPLDVEQSQWNVTVNGEPGDSVWIAYSTEPGFSLPSPTTGALLVPSGSANFRTHIVVPMSGTLVVPVRIGRVGATGGRFLFLQGLVHDASGNDWYASPLHLLTLDKQSLPDCNANSLLDLIDIIDATSADLDHDVTPDECDPDCNSNGARTATTS
jgi:hypothetical protein